MPDDINLNKNAVYQFAGNPKDTILKIGKDSQGREFLVAKKKNVFTWLATFIFSSYSLKKVVGFISSHKDEFNKKLYTNQMDSFYKGISEKITHFNAHRKNSEPLKLLDVNHVGLRVLMPDQQSKVDLPAQPPKVKPTVPLNDTAQGLNFTAPEWGEKTRHFLYALVAVKFHPGDGLVRTCKFCLLNTINKLKLVESERIEFSNETYKKILEYLDKEPMKSDPDTRKSIDEFKELISSKCTLV